MYLDEKALGEEAFDHEVALKKKINDLVDIQAVIKWLETKDPEEAYNFMACGSCLFAQYLQSRGVKTPMDSAAWGVLHKQYRGVAAHKPQTFGAALTRAKEGIFAYDFDMRDYF